MDSLRERSIKVILANQHPSGAYVASPAFANYQYCWLRDGSFIAHAMDQVGETESARQYFRWVAATIQRYAFKVDAIEKKRKASMNLVESDILNTRFELEGIEENPESGWGNFQIDGYGTWLWALSEHVRMTGDVDLLNEVSGAVSTTLRYLTLVWDLPNYDCWEEHPEYLHPYSLAPVFSGFQAASGLARQGLLHTLPVDAAEQAETIHRFIERCAIFEGRLVKHLSPAIGDLPARPVSESTVDASLLGMAYPFKVFDPMHPVMSATVGDIETSLHRKGGGVYRYAADIYYGGGEWILLTAWLGLYYLHTGRTLEAGELLEWIEAQADADGNLPEQVNDHALTPAQYEPWLKKWGPVASPLLWSHAMYLLLYEELHRALNSAASSSESARPEQL